MIYIVVSVSEPVAIHVFSEFGGEFCALGSSPELHVRVRGRIAELRPIAGTRPRGDDAISDERNARELLADPKERAEHVMLIDLARNDLGRVAANRKCARDRANDDRALQSRHAHRLAC